MRDDSKPAVAHLRRAISGLVPSAGWNEDWRKAFVELPGSSDSELECDVWVEEPTLILQRDTFANFFHNSEDFFNTFIALAVLKWNTRDLQIILGDLYPKGPFWYGFLPTPAGLCPC